MAKDTPNPTQSPHHDAAPLYLEMICNQFPEAERVLIRIVTMCRYKVHGGFTLSAEDYRTIMQIPVLSDALERITSQAAQLYALNKSITDLTDKKAETEEIAEKLGIDLNEKGLINPEEYQQKMDDALEVHKEATDIFRQTIDDIDQWIDENLDYFKTYEENLANNMLNQLQSPLDHAKAKKIIEKEHPNAQDKNERIEAMKQQYEIWRQKTIEIFSLPIVERRIALAQILT